MKALPKVFRRARLISEQVIKLSEKRIKKGLIKKVDGVLRRTVPAPSLESIANTE